MKLISDYTEYSNKRFWIELIEKYGSLQSDYNRGSVAEKMLQIKDTIRPSYITAKGQKLVYTSEVSQISFELCIMLLENYVSIIYRRHLWDI